MALVEIPIFFFFIAKYISQENKILHVRFFFSILCSPHLSAEELPSTFVMQCVFFFILDCALSCHNVIKMNLNGQKFLTNLFMSVCMCILMHICG